MEGMNKLNTKDRAQIIRCLCEGTSIRATSRITGRSQNTIQKLLKDMGAACAEHHNNVVRNVECYDLELDEVWSFVGCKQKNAPAHLKGSPEKGDCWTWTAIDERSKMIVSYFVGDRELPSARAFANDLAARVKGKPQISSDGYSPYRLAVASAFGLDANFGMIVGIMRLANPLPYLEE